MFPVEVVDQAGDEIRRNQRLRQKVQFLLQVVVHAAAQIIVQHRGELRGAFPQFLDDGCRKPGPVLGDAEIAGNHFVPEVAEIVRGEIVPQPGAKRRFDMRRDERRNRPGIALQETARHLADPRQKRLIFQEFRCRAAEIFRHLIRVDQFRGNLFCKFVTDLILVGGDQSLPPEAEHHIAQPVVIGTPVWLEEHLDGEKIGEVPHHGTGENRQQPFRYPAGRSPHAGEAQYQQHPQPRQRQPAYRADNPFRQLDDTYGAGHLQGGLVRFMVEVLLNIHSCSCNRDYRLVFGARSTRPRLTGAVRFSCGVTAGRPLLSSSSTSSISLLARVLP